MDLLVDFPVAPSSFLRNFPKPLRAISRSTSLPVGPAPRDADDISACDRGFIDDTVLTLTRERAKPLLVDFPSRSPSDDEACPCRRVMFADEENRVHPVQNFAIDHKDEYWYDEIDLELFAKERDQDVYMIKVMRKFGGENKSTPSPQVAEAMAKFSKMRSESGSTPVGLENYVGGATPAEMQARRAHHNKAVMDEVDAQWRRGCADIPEGEALQWDQEAIAEASRGRSAWGRRRAELIGAAHAQGSGRKSPDARADNDNDKCEKSAARATLAKRQAEAGGGPDLPAMPVAA